MAEAFETKTTEETGRLLHSTDPGGLSAEEARKRLEQYGPNRLQEPEQPGFFSRLLSQFMDPLIYVLAAAGVISVFLGEIGDACIIAAVAALNGAVGMIQEGKAKRALDALKKMTRLKAVVRRDQTDQEIDAAELVPGDLVVLDADLAAATKTGMFRKAYPNRHFDCGIAEANMMGVAAGLSTMGYVPFVSSFAMFAAGRAFEQIRNSVAYPRLNVKIGATHGGISVGEDGASHQCCEDFALMRSLPGMTIICPADDVEARAAVRAAYEMQGPVYLRFGRLAVPVFHDEANYHFEIGKGEQLTEGNDIAIVATGLMVNEARKAAETLAAEGIHARVLNIHTIKPLDEDIILKAAKECGKIVTAEEHNVIGGLGEAVCSLLSEKLPTPVRRVGVQDKFGCSGPAWDLLREYGLDAATICKTAKEMLGR